MTSFSLTSEMRADGIYLFESGKEVGLIKRENGHGLSTCSTSHRPSPLVRCKRLSTTRSRATSRPSG